MGKRRYGGFVVIKGVVGGVVVGGGVGRLFRGRGGKVRGRGWGVGGYGVGGDGFDWVWMGMEGESVGKMEGIGVKKRVEGVYDESGLYGRKMEEVGLGKCRKSGGWEDKVGCIGI